MHATKKIVNFSTEVVSHLNSGNHKAAWFAVFNANGETWESEGFARCHDRHVRLLRSNPDAEVVEMDCFSEWLRLSYEQGGLAS